MTFYGEALGLDWANAITGTIDASGEPMHYLYRDSTSQTVAAGDSFIAGIFPNSQQLVSGDVAVISWAVEVSGSGVLSFSSGLDPTWNLDTPSYASESLGSVTVAGAETVVLAQTTITAADILAEASQPILYVQCTSGSVSIAQVRLRVWPVGGPAGAWAPGGSFTEQGSFTSYQAGAAGSVTTASGPGAAADAARAAFYADTPSDWSGTGSPLLHSVAQVNPPDPLGNWGGNFGKDVAYLQFESSVVATTTAGQAGTHPDIVPGDLGGSVRAVGGGPLYSEFGSWSGGIRIAESRYVIDSTTELGPISATLAFDATELTLTPLGGGFYAGPVPFPTGGASVALNDLVALPASPHLVIGVESDEWYTNPPADRQELVSAQLESVAVTALVPAHEWWDPSLPWVERKPRFFVKDYEGAWRPVGFGKPASDLSRFHVWTPVGWYVECLDGETYTNAHPLKVKLYDGTWDTVAHMRPL